MKVSKEKTQNSKSRRLSKIEEEKRKVLLSKILNKWVYIKDNYSDEKNVYYVKHLLGPKGKTSRIIQVLISGYEEQDGIYEISDYEIGYVWDARNKKKILDIKPKKYDLTYGLYSESKFAKTYDELLDYMVRKGYVTKKELSAMLNENNYYLNLEEIKLSFYRHYRNKKMLEGLV